MFKLFRNSDLLVNLEKYFDKLHLSLNNKNITILHESSKFRKLKQNVSWSDQSANVG